MRPAVLSSLPASAPVYTASAVHFDGATYLTNASLTASIVKALTYVVWFKTTTTNGEATFYVVDPDDTVVPYFDMTGGKLDLEAAADPSPASVENLTTATFNDGVWHSLIYSIDSSTSAPFQLALYIDGVKITVFTIAANTGTAFIPLGNGAVAQIGFDNTDANGYYVGDMADKRIFYGVSILDGSGNISPTNLALFINGSGKPVDPTIAVMALGTPTISFTGNAAAWATNTGSGGAFATTGTLTDAATHP